MPKLRYSCSSNISSISSQSDLSLPTGKTYQRCFSNETDITVVDGNTGEWLIECDNKTVNVLCNAIIHKYLSELGMEGLQLLL